LEEPSGLDVLKSLLETITGYNEAHTTVDEPVLAKDAPCQVAECKDPAVFRCSLGWRYCATHARIHGMRDGRHTFELIASRSLDHIKAAEAKVRERISAGEGKDEFL